MLFRSDGDDKYGGKTYSIDWHDPYEPFYIASKKYVKYDERFEQVCGL